ncbi:MAG: folate-binding protein YgfZ [Methylobacteriaceae bacterium]|nr:folate-binding protein YgfZ [Methylobacteriaceae bacterium]
MKNRTEPSAAVCVLDDRGVIEVVGEDAAGFLQGIVTNDILRVAPGAAEYAALLAPQGKILFDFLLAAPLSNGTGRFLLDCPSHLAPDLARRLGFYRLRAKVTIADRSAALSVVAAWGPDADDLPGRLIGTHIVASFRDPRHADLGWRCIVERAALADLSPETRAAATIAAYEDHRIGLGVPKGGPDFAYGDAFPHEANLDRLNGIDFNKGCYVGQEVVSRVEHRGLARKRIVAVRFEGAAPEAGTEVTSGGGTLGVMGSSGGGKGLAMVRIERAEAAIAAGMTIVAGERAIEVLLPG